MNARTFLLLAALVIPAASAQGQAQAQKRLELQTNAQRPMPTQMRWRLFAFGLGGSALATATTALIYMRVYGASQSDYSDNIGALVRATAIAGAVATVFVPLSTTAFVYHAGKHRGYRGTTLRTFAGALGGFAAGSLLGAGLYVALAWRTDTPQLAALISSMALGAAVTAGIAMRSYRLSDERAVRLAPSLAPAVGARGLTLGVSGRF